MASFAQFMLISHKQTASMEEYMSETL